MQSRAAVAALVVALAALGAPARAQAEPVGSLDWFKPLVGRTWKATLPNGSVDVHRFDLILNGRVLRTVHSVDGGVYGGVAHVYWDEEKRTLAAHYVTTAGFFTTATIRIEDGVMRSHEVVHGGAGGVTEVKAESRVTPDGRLVVKTQQLRGGEWVAGGDRTYVEDPGGEVTFKP